VVHEVVHALMANCQRVRGMLKAVLLVWSKAWVGSRSRMRQGGRAITTSSILFSFLLTREEANTDRWSTSSTSEGQVATCASCVRVCVCAMCVACVLRVCAS
jgi:hypothetical protein